MAMDKDRVGAAAAAAVALLSTADKRDPVKVYTAILGAMITEIKDHATVAPLTQSGISIAPGSVITQGVTVEEEGVIS